MKRKRLKNTRNHINKDVVEGTGINQLTGGLILGDVIWVGIHSDSWWPAQVVDENTVSERNKPKSRRVEEILVRLYGSYEYLYVDPLKCQSEFAKILKQNNVTCSETFQKALQQDISPTKSGRLKKRVSKSREKAIVEIARGKKSKQEEIMKNLEIDFQNSTQDTLGKRLDATVRGKRTTQGDPPARTTQGDPPAENSKDEAFNKKEKTKQDSVGKNSKTQGRASARGSTEQLVTRPLRTRVKRGLFAEKANEKSSKIGTPKQDGAQKKVKRGLFAEKASKESSKIETPKQDGAQKKQKTNSLGSATVLLEKSKSLSERRMRVMQSLGLIAPFGSPFHKNGLLLST